MVPLDSHACIRTSPSALCAWFHVLRQATGNILLMYSFRDYSVARAIGKWLPECAKQTRGRKPFKRVGRDSKGVTLLCTGSKEVCTNLLGAACRGR
jgi:hypothetical protein